MDGNMVAKALDLKTENDALKSELKACSDTCQKLGIEKEEWQKRCDELLKENSFLRGQVKAYEFCMSCTKGGD